MDGSTFQYYFYTFYTKVTNASSYGYPTSLILILLLTFTHKIFLLIKEKKSSLLSSVQKTKEKSRIKRCTSLLVLCKLFFFHLIQPVQLTSHPVISLEVNFTYDLTDLTLGPRAWQGDCASGREQSPIDIGYKDYGTFWGGGGYTKIFFSREYYEPSDGFYFMNDGHTFEIQFNDDHNNPTSNYILSGPSFGHQYTFAQLHFHWGERGQPGSDHALHGKRYPMEIHIVHYKSSYGNLSNALSENHRDREAVAAFAVFCELGDENAALRPIVEAASSPFAFAPSTELKYDYQSINILQLLPRQLDFVHYLGSLTSPPCSEKVAWTIFLSTISISPYQAEVFQNLRDKDNERYYNYRPLQPRNGRILKYYKVEGEQSSLSPYLSSISRIQRSLTNTLQGVNSIILNLLYNLYKMNTVIIV